MNCPICASALTRRTLPQGVEVDLCDDHGVWLDKGELEKLVSQESAPGSTGSDFAETAKETALDVAKQFGRSMTFGAGATAGSRLVGGMLDALFKKKNS